MHFIDILSRIRNLLLYPAREWEVIAMEDKKRKTIFLQFVLPLLCLITVASVTGSLLFVTRTIFSLGYLASRIILLWCSLCSGLYLSAFVITEISADRINRKDHDKEFALLAYSLGPALLVIMLVELFPFFNELLILTFYSCYLYWRGIPYLMQVEGQNQMIFGILSFVIVTFVFGLMFFFFGNILEAIFDNG